MVEKKNLIMKLQDRIKEIKMSVKREGEQEDNLVKEIVRRISTIRKSLMTEKKFIGMSTHSENKKFGRTTLKTCFEETVDLPYQRFELFQKSINIY